MEPVVVVGGIGITAGIVIAFFIYKNRPKK